MNFIRNIFKQHKEECPRCLGKGHVDQDDINRLNKQLRWLPGKCAYCKGKGKVSSEMIKSVSPDEAYLTTNVGNLERNRMFRNDAGAIDRSEQWNTIVTDMIDEIESLHQEGLSPEAIGEEILISHWDDIDHERRVELVRYVRKVIDYKSNPEK